MQEIKKDKKKLVLLGLFILGISVFSIIGLVLLSSSNQDSSNSNSADSSDNTVEQIVEPTQEIPSLPNYVTDFVVFDSVDALNAIWTEAKAWSSDVRIHDVQALPYTYEDPNTGEKTYYGHEQGKFMLWNVSLYSPSKSESTVASYDKDGVDISEAFSTATTYGDFSKDLPYFNDIESYVSASLVYTNLIANGFDDVANYPSFRLGEPMNTSPYYNKPVWKVTERSKTEMDEYGTGVELTVYYFDAITGDFLSKEAL